MNKNSSSFVKYNPKNLFGSEHIPCYVVVWYLFSRQIVRLQKMEVKLQIILLVKMK